MSVSQQIERLQNAKENIKTAIANKNVEIAENVSLDEYANYIDEIAKDTTATAADVLKGKTAYVKGEKVVGTALSIPSTAKMDTILKGYTAYDSNGNLMIGTKDDFVTGTVTATQSTSLTISGLDFTPSHIMLTLETAYSNYGGTSFLMALNARGSTVWHVSGKWTSLSAGYFTHNVGSGAFTVTYADGSVTLSNSSSINFYAGTYGYIIW